jgi:hypothetical protein
VPRPRFGERGVRHDPTRRLSGAAECLVACHSSKLAFMAVRSLWRSLSIAGLLPTLLVLGCGNGKSPSAGAGGGGGGPPREVPDTTSCTTPQEGCPCDEENEVIECGIVARHSEDYTACSMGERICVDGKWGACEGDRIAELPDSGPGQKAQGVLSASRRRQR